MEDDDFGMWDEEGITEIENNYLANAKKRKEQEDMRTLENMDLSTIEKYLRHKKLENILKK